VTGFHPVDVNVCVGIGLTAWGHFTVFCCLESNYGFGWWAGTRSRREASRCARMAGPVFLEVAAILRQCLSEHFGNRHWGH